MNIRYVLFLVSYFIFSFNVSKGQEYAYFDHFSTNEGLVSNRIFSLTQDSVGFIWIATDFGMERFDGTKFKHYQKKDYPSLCRDDILFVQYLKKNKIVVGGYNGLLLEYDCVADDFKDKMPADFENSYYKEVRGIYIPEKGDKYAYTIGGLYRYDERKELYTTDFAAFDSLQYKYIRTVYVDEFNRFWVGSVDNLFVFDSQGKLLKKFDFSFSPCGFITNIIPFDGDKIAVSSLSDELWIFTIESGKIGVPEVIKLPFGSVTQMLRDSKGRFWFASDGDGLWYTDDPWFRTHGFKSLIPFDSKPDDIKKIYALMEDNSGDIWIGTQNSGIWRYKREDRSGVVFSSDLGFPTAVCSSFSEDKEGNLIVGSDGSGIFFVSPDFKQIRQFKLENNNIPSLIKSSDGKIKVATWGGGIISFDPNSRKSEKEKFSGIPLPVKCFFSISEMPDGKLWACSASDGLYIRDLNKKWYKKELKDDSLSKYPNNWIYSAVKGKKDTEWVLTTSTLWIIKNGICRALLPDVSTVKLHNPLALTDAECDNEGNLFVATNDGVIRFSSDGTSYEKLNFLPSASYRIIKKDNKGIFWVAGSNGILSFDYENKNYSYLPGNYSDLSKSYFYSRAGFKDSKGNLYFGTNGGFFTFDPKNIIADTSVAYLAFSEFYLSGEKIKPYQGILKEGNISQLKKIELKYGQSNIALTLDLIDFSDFNKVQCRYRLLGLNEKWIELGQNRRIVFNYIPSGDYKLEVEAYRSNVKSERKIISLELMVLPPWWASWWFRLLAFLLLMLTVVLIFWIRMQNMVRKQNQLKEKVQERTQELNIALCEKDRLISVIAHDLKNPMFAIVGALEIWLKRESELEESDKRRTINEIYDSARTLQEEMLKLLEWARSGQDEIICHFSNANIEEITDNVLLLLYSMISDKQLIVSRNFNLKNYVYADPRMLEIVIRNLLSNSVKFTPLGGSIFINSWQDGTIIKMQITDTGIGMDDVQIRNLYSSGSRFSTAGTQKEEGTGLGIRLCQDYISRNGGKMEIKSKKGEGTSVTLSFPISGSVLEKEYDKVKEGSENVDIEVDFSLLEGNTIMIVDDDPLICRNLSAMLLGKEVNIFIASNGKEALEQIEEYLPDVILSDVEMPVMNGIEMSKVLGRSARTSHVPILFISAKNEESDRLLGLLSGAIDYISKPFSQTELLIKLTNILKIRQKQQQKVLKEWIVGQDTPTTDWNEKINPFLEDFFKILEESYTNGQLTIEDLAKAISVSQSTLNRRVKSLTGKTPLELLTEYRLNIALRYLKDKYNNMSVSDIAYKVGFNDPAYFTRKFRESFGYPPSQVKL